MKFLTVMIALSWFFSLATHATDDIVIKRDKNGKIILTNEPVYKKKSSRRSYVKSSQTQGVPYVYLSKISRLAAKHQIRKDLVVAVARAESSFNPNAVSRKGAVGIMQLMYDTAKQYGVKNRFNVDQNLDAGIRHLKYLYRKFNHNIPLTLAAYNAGEEAIKKFKGIPPYRETKNYIRKVMRYMGMGYSGYIQPKLKTKIYKYITKKGKIIITDTLPANVEGKVEIID